MLDFSIHSVSCAEREMIRLSLPYVYGLAAAIEPLGTIKIGAKFSDYWLEMLTARNEVDTLINRSIFSGALRSSHQHGQNLIDGLKNYLEPANANNLFDTYQVSAINWQLNQFKTVLLAEMTTLNAHFVTQKRGYDTTALMEFAEVIFPPDLSAKVPAAIPDIREAGKCISFELSTAAGFHLHRANESILHRYYDAVTGGKPPPDTRNIGDYLKKLKEHGVGDARLIAALKDLKDLHRNPLIHPDQSLESVDEAIALLNAIHTAAVYMLKAIPAPAGALTQAGAVPSA